MIVVPMSYNYYETSWLEYKNNKDNFDFILLGESLYYNQTILLRILLPKENYTRICLQNMDDQINILMPVPVFLTHSQQKDSLNIQYWKFCFVAYIITII